jgi:hypothetical protein
MFVRIGASAHSFYQGGSRRGADSLQNSFSCEPTGIFTQSLDEQRYSFVSQRVTKGENDAG